VEEIKKKKNSTFTNIMLIVALITSIGLLLSTIWYKRNSLSLISSLISIGLIVIFSFLYVVSNYNSKRKLISLSALVLIIYNIFGILVTTNLISLPIFNQVKDFRGKSVADVITWASKNNIEATETYEYSDMIGEYKVIAQNIEPGTSLNKIKKMDFSISMGPNPDKEVVISDMLTWDLDKVLDYIKEKKLTNVVVEFSDSDKEGNTVIDQSKSGTMKRSDELKLTFAKKTYDSIKLRSLVGLSKFEATCYLKEYGISYDEEEVYNSKVKKGYIVKQSVKAGTTIKNGDGIRIKLEISKGPEIIVPNLKKMSITEITNWIIKNKLKLEFIEKYDDGVSNGKFMSANVNSGDKISQGTLVSITISKGKISMPSFSNITDFYDWCSKYGIKYSEKHEFSDSVEAGKVISYSYKAGDTIKNNDTITVTISDGKKCSVPDVGGLSREKAISKIKSAGLSYTTIYQASSSVSKDYVIRTSISSGSEVSCSTTVTIVLSSGKATSSSKSSSSSSNTSGGSSNNTTTCVPCSYKIVTELNNVFNNNSGFDNTSSALYSFFASKCPSAKINVEGVSDTGMASGSYVGGIGPGDTIEGCNNKTYTIQIAK
jgi:beta-lactam-binding protein with PASTA domain